MYKTASTPFFNHTIMKKPGLTFVVKTGTEIPQVSKAIDFERLMTKPKHKPNRAKYDKNRSECAIEKENNP